MTPATTYPFSPKPYEPSTANSGLEWRYGIVDTLNVKWNNIFDQPLSITAGRQDIMLGDADDWWLVADGTPGDGSWTMYFGQHPDDLRRRRTITDQVRRDLPLPKRPARRLDSHARQSGD